MRDVSSRLLLRMAPGHYKESRTVHLRNVNGISPTSVSSKVISPPSPSLVFSGGIIGSIPRSPPFIITPLRVVTRRGAPPPLLSHKKPHQVLWRAIYNELQRGNLFLIIFLW